MTDLWRRYPWLVAAFGLAVVLCLGLTALAISHAPPRGDENFRPVQAWMTPRYLVHNYDLEPPEVAAILKMEPGSDPKLPLQEIVAAHGLDLQQVLAELDATVARKAEAEHRP